MSSSENKERRSTFRAPVLLVLTYRLPGGQAFPDRYAYNISEGGVFIVTGESHPVGTELEIEIRGAEGASPFLAKGVVRWLRKPDPQSQQVPGLGVQFTQVDPENQARLQKMLELHQSLQGS